MIIINIRRNIVQKLQKWKEWKDRKPLILQGARQIGKTTAIRMFAQESYAHLAEFNFDKNKELKTLFERTKDIKRILQELTFFTDVPIQSEGTLIFFDEIQECEEALNSLKYFEEDAPQYHIVAAGSLLGVALNMTPAKVIAELTLGFWVSLLNSEYERLLWKHLRRAFPYMPKHLRQRKNVSAPLNSFRTFRNRVFHHESICWNLHRVSEIHDSLSLMLEWMNKDLPLWLKTIDRFEDTKKRICLRMNWNNE